MYQTVTYHQRREHVSNIVHFSSICSLFLVNEPMATKGKFLFPHKRQTIKYYLILSDLSYLIVNGLSSRHAYRHRLHHGLRHWLGRLEGRPGCLRRSHKDRPDHPPTPTSLSVYCCLPGGKGGEAHLICLQSRSMGVIITCQSGRGRYVGLVDLVKFHNGHVHMNYDGRPIVWPAYLSGLKNNRLAIISQ